ncbi:MAG: plastocyanin/azurin family copper-binding protein [Anaerolineales bacterium]
MEWQGDFSVHPLASDDGLWRTVSGGSTFSFTFNSPGGTYPYHCQVRQALGMTGEVIVKSP